MTLTHVQLDREIQKRERIVEILLIISGFFLAYSGEHTKIMVGFFIMFVTFALTYLLFNSRTKNSFAINLGAIYTALFFSLFFIAFLEFSIGDVFTNGHIVFITFSILLSFSLLEPETSESIIAYFGKFNKYIDKYIEKSKTRRIFFVIISVAIVLGLIYLIYFI